MSTSENDDTHACMHVFMREVNTTRQLSLHCIHITFKCVIAWHEVLTSRRGVYYLDRFVASRRVGMITRDAEHAAVAKGLASRRRDVERPPPTF